MNLGDMFDPATVDIKVSMSGGIGVEAAELDINADTGASKILGNMSTHELLQAAAPAAYVTVVGDKAE